MTVLEEKIISLECAGAALEEAGRAMRLAGYNHRREREAVEEIRRDIEDEVAKLQTA